MKSVVNLKDCYCEGVKPSIAYKYEFFINNDSYEWENQYVTGNELHKLAGTSPETHFIRMRTNENKNLIGPNIKVDLTECGIERFIILPFVQETLDLHDCFCQGVKPYITYKYIIKINRDKFEVEQETITGSEIIRLINKDPKTHRVRMFTSNGKMIIKNDEEVDLTACGVERFVVEPLDCTEGFIISTPFKQLLSEDFNYLKSHSNVDFITDGAGQNGTSWLIIRSFPIPKGYNVETADIAFFVPVNYPAGGLDMIYFYPHLRRIDGKPIGALASQNIEGKEYQRWSRHRTQLNRWDHETDNLESHIDLMMNCLIDEFKKR
jgi:hypothetical protein